MTESTSQCPFSGANTAKGTSATEQWWPEQLNLKILHQHSLKPIRWGMASTTPQSSKHSIWRR